MSTADAVDRRRPIWSMLGTVISFGLVIAGCGMFLLILAVSGKQTCALDGPSPANALISEVPGTVRQTMSLWPLGRACDAALNDGGRQTVMSGSIPQTLMVYGFIAVGLAGTVVSVRALVGKGRGSRDRGPSSDHSQENEVLSIPREPGEFSRRRRSAVLIVVLLAGASLFTIGAILAVSPAIVLAAQLSSSTPAELCRQAYAPSDPSIGTLTSHIEGTVAWDPFSLQCTYANVVTNELVTDTGGWNAALAVWTVLLLSLTAVSFLLAMRLQRLRDVR